MSAKLPEKLSNEIASGVSELYIKFNCNYCQEDIPGLRIKCAECKDFDLCLDCFSCGAQIAKHKSHHKYMFMNNGGFRIFPEPPKPHRPTTKRASLINAPKEEESTTWNARDEMRLLDAIEQYGYGNWKDIANHIENKSVEEVKEEFITHYIHGLVGKHTWKEELRGYQIDHTQAADRGPLSPTLTGKLPPIAVSGQEALLLGYMPHRDDFEDFDKDTENLVSQIADKSVEDEDLDVALKLSQCDIYERRLREQVRRKRVARDYQLVSRFYRENPIVEIGFGAKFSPQKISNQIKAVTKGDGPKQEIIDSLKCVTPFCTAQEFHNLINNLCVGKELKVRVRELIKYREHGIKKISELVPFEKQRYKQEMKLKQRKYKLNKTGNASGTATPNPNFSSVGSKFLPTYGDYSLKALLDIDYETKEKNLPTSLMKKRAKKSKWSRKKEKTGRRKLLEYGCILTVADPQSQNESTDVDGGADTS